MKCKPLDAENTKYLITANRRDENPIDDLAEVARMVQSHFNHPLSAEPPEDPHTTLSVLFDMTLINGRNSNRFLETTMQDGEINRDAFKIVDMETMTERTGQDFNSTNKFLLYDMYHHGFIGDDMEMACVGNDLQKAAILSYGEFADFGGRALPDMLRIPLTRELVDALPFELKDTAPQIPHTSAAEYNAFLREPALGGDFVVLTEYGFYDEKYNSTTESSRPQIRSFELDYANLYNMEQLEELNTAYITEPMEGIPPIIVPVSKEQQGYLQKIPEFSSEQEPHGFFMTPIGPSEAEVQSDAAVAEFTEGLDALGEECPFDEDFAAAVDDLSDDSALEM